MKVHPLFCLPLFTLGLAAADMDNLERFDQARMGSGVRQEASTAKSGRAPKIDPNQIVNESNSFLKEREPEMTAAEYALYEKVLSMIASNPAFAMKLLEAMNTEKEPASPAFEFILGNVYYAAGEHAKAEASYLNSVKRFPTFLRAWNNLGVMYYSTERFVEAAPCFSKAIVLGDRDPVTFGLLGFSLEQADNLVSAEMAYMQALAGDPANGDWKEGLLRIYVRGRQFGRAESLVKTLIKERPQETRFWMTYANILLADNRKLQALALLETAAGMGIAKTEELSLLGDLYADQSLMTEALAVYERTLKLAPEVGERKLLHYAQVLIASRKFTEGERVLNSLRGELSPHARAELLQARTDVFVGQERWDDARKEVDALLKLSPLNGRALLSSGRIYAATQDLPRAMFEFEAAYRVPAATYHASLELAQIEIKNRHYGKSVEYLEKALSIEKTDAVEDYLARVKTLASATN